MTFHSPGSNLRLLDRLSSTLEPQRVTIAPHYVTNTSLPAHKFDVIFGMSATVKYTHVLQLPKILCLPAWWGSVLLVYDTCYATCYIHPPLARLSSSSFSANRFYWNRFCSSQLMFQADFRNDRLAKRYCTTLTEFSGNYSWCMLKWFEYNPTDECNLYIRALHFNIVLVSGFEVDKYGTTEHNTH